MKITAQEEYGLRCLLQLARAREGRIVNVGEIAAKEGLSRAYVEKLLRLLARAGLVHSVRGINGGYALSKPARDIRLADVIRALGAVPATDGICQSFTGNQDACVHFDECSIRSVWAGLTAYIQAFLEQTRLSNLLESESGVAAALNGDGGKQTADRPE